MKVKIDENLPAEIAADLRALGHDAMTVVDQGMAGIDDERLMSRVEEEFRVFMTMDKGTSFVA
jgi:predicted nuclease of predicted toxin-antitoxin system